MADLALSHLIKYAHAREDANGLVFVEGYLVQNVSGRTALLDALFYAGIPAYGEPLSGYPGIVVIDRIPKPYLDSRTDVIVEIVYGPPGILDLNQTIIRFHGTTREVETSMDINKNIIHVNYAPVDGELSLPEQVGRVRDTKAMGVLEFDFIVQDDPEPVLEYLNTINSDTWRGQPKWCWKWEDIRIEQVRYRSGFRLYMAAVYDEETHIQTAFYRLPDGSIPADIDTPVNIESDYGNGWTNPELRGERDFNDLNLPTTFTSPT